MRGVQGVTSMIGIIIHENDCSGWPLKFLSVLYYFQMSGNILHAFWQGLRNCNEITLVSRIPLARLLAKVTDTSYA